MLRKTMLCCILCIAAAAFSPAVSLAAMMNGVPGVFKYAVVTETDGGMQNISGELDNNGGQSWLYSWDGSTGEFAFLDEMVLQYWNFWGQGGVVKFSQTIEGLGLPGTEPQVVGYDFNAGLLVSDDNAHGNCYFVAYVPLYGESGFNAGYEEGYGFFGYGPMLCIMGSATLNIDGYPGGMFVRGGDAQNQAEPPPGEMYTATVNAKLMAAGAVMIFVEDGYVDWFNAQRAAARVSLDNLTFTGGFCCN